MPAASRDTAGPDSPSPAHPPGAHGPPTVAHANPLGAHAHPPGDLERRVLDALPQTQCTRCGFPDCAGYAHAIAAEGAPIDRCPPGGQEGIVRLARLTGRPAVPLDPAHGTEGPRAVAFIDEDWCIGCTLCLKACPTDAIVGANKRMHTVIEPYCTGCGLCLPICPVDCILLEDASGARTGWDAWTPVQAAQARERYEIHSYRGRRDAGESPIFLESLAVAAEDGALQPMRSLDGSVGERAAGTGPAAAELAMHDEPTAKAVPPTSPVPPAPPATAASDGTPDEARRAAVAAAMARARARRAPSPPTTPSA